MLRAGQQSGPECCERHTRANGLTSGHVLHVHNYTQTKANHTHMFEYSLTKAVMETTLVKHTSQRLGGAAFKVEIGMSHDGSSNSRVFPI